LKRTEFGSLYRGREGQWSWIAHRVTGVGILAFLFVHVVDTALVASGPEAYNRVVSVYHHPIVQVMELGLVGAVLFHALNGIRIMIIEFWPKASQFHAHTGELLKRLLSSTGTQRIPEIREELQESMSDVVGVVRTEESGRKMQDILGSLRERYGRAVVQDKGRVYNTDLMEAVELEFLLDCAETLVAAALARDESRGGHYREDHPLRDDEHWLRHSLAYREPDGSVRLEYKPVKLGSYVPMERKY
jgi:succinate dehydrogenase cytochrome b556 subunit